MSVNLNIKPHVAPMSRDEFVLYAGPYSIALDGFVCEAPWYLEKDGNFGPYRNFNHHEKVDRTSTRATCGQVLFAIRSGLFQAFRTTEPCAEIFVNDCDEDVCLSWFLLHNSHLAYTPNPLLNRLVDIVDKLDTSSGSYALLPDSPVMNELAWVFDPYRKFRLSGRLSYRNADEFKSVIEDVENRIMLHIVGKGKALPLDTQYETLSVNKGWVLVREIGPQSRNGMFSDGIKAFVSVRDDGQGRYDYVVGRQSEYIPFPISVILKALNVAEGTSDCADKWGGGDTIGGSPRIAGSKLNPETISKVIEMVMIDRHSNV